MTYEFTEIEKKWQQRWADEGAYRVPNPGEPGFDADKPKLYILDMFPYPSGSGLHVGHPLGYIGTDIYSRYKRTRGFNVLHPMGFDSFGLPAEQYAVETGVHPAVTTGANIATYTRQLKAYGLSYDWDRGFATTDADYYRWTQWIFLRLFHSWFDPDENRARPIDELRVQLEDGTRTAEGRPWTDLSEIERRAYLDGKRLAYIDEVPVNWCPGLGTVLANEEVTADGRSERGNFPVYRRPLRQWMLRITAYADRLIEDLELIDWPESVNTMQRNWIGRSEGAWIDFPVAGLEPMRVFTTRPDTVFGATYMVTAPEHSILEDLVPDAWPEGTLPAWTAGADTPAEAVNAYRAAAEQKSELERQTEDREKTGVFTGAFALNPLTNQQIPIFVADYVLASYGTGAIMAVPGQDERDWEYAEIYDLPIVRTVEPAPDFEGKAYLGEGAAINSGFLDGLGVADAKQAINEWLEENGAGERATTYKLRDWLFSRQRYWGEPIPILHGPDGELRAVPDDQLPVELPDIEDFSPSASDDENADPVPGLTRADDDWKTVEIDGVTYTRELNTMPQWAGSCWYYLRFIDPRNEERFVGEAAERYWMGDLGVDLYVGGVEHAVLHLLYVRFWHKALYDLGYVSTPEPFGRLFNQGYITADAYQDERGFYVPAEEVVEANGRFEYDGKPVTPTAGKMGKSLKNAVSPDAIFDEYGVDTLRLYEMFMGPLDADRPWSTRDIVGVHRFLQRLWRRFVDPDSGALRVVDEPPSPEVERLMHRTIAAVSRDMDELGFNTSIARLFEFNNALIAEEQLSREAAEAMVQLLAPFAPHVAAELWERLGHQDSIMAAGWPEARDDLVQEETTTLIVQVNGKVRDRIEVPVDIDEADAVALALASERVLSYTGGDEPRKVIARPPNIVSVVV